MRLLSRQTPDRTEIVLHMGIGLIGQSIQLFLDRAGFSIDQIYKLSWADRENIVASIKQASFDVTRKAHLYSPRIHLIWSAGKAGFSASPDDFDIENFALDTLIYLARELSGPYTVSFHLLSSAGGLFEGQRCVGPETKPAPLRPYGTVKFDQERRVLALPDRVIKHIYRASSVYGYYATRNRTGLVTALVQKGLIGKSVQIYGRPDTLRDFVFVDDIGAYITSKIINAPGQDSTDYLVGGKPTSMFEMLGTVQKILGKRLNFRFIKDADNTAHMSFNRSLFAPNWCPTILSVGLKKTAIKIHRDFI